MKRLTLIPNPKTRYKNGSPRYGSPAWCKKVANNKTLTPSDHQRIAEGLREAGLFKALIQIHKLKTAKLWNPKNKNTLPLGK